MSEENGKMIKKEKWYLLFVRRENEGRDEFA